MEKIITSESSRNPEDPRRLADVLDRLKRIERKIDRLDEQGKETIRDELDAYRRRQEVPELLERDETAEALRISQRKLSTLTAAGEISHIRIGRRVLYPAKAIRAYVHRCAEEGKK